MKFMVGVSRFDPIPVAVSYIRRAEYVTVPLTIKSDQKYHRDRLIEIEKTKAYVEQEARKGSLISVGSGAKQITNTEKSGMLSSGQTTTTIMLRAALSDETSSLFSGAEQIQNFLDGLSPNGKAELAVGNASLDVENPESYRETILGLIYENMKTTMIAFGGKNSVSISGLESPVFICQVDERNIGCYIKYWLGLKISER